MDVLCLRDWQGHGSGSGTLRSGGHGGDTHTGWPGHANAGGANPQHTHTHTHTYPVTQVGGSVPHLWPLIPHLSLIPPTHCAPPLHLSSHYHLRCWLPSPTHSSAYLILLLIVCQIRLGCWHWKLVFKGSDFVQFLFVKTKVIHKYTKRKIYSLSNLKKTLQFEI